MELEPGGYLVDQVLLLKVDLLGWDQPVLLEGDGVVLHDVGGDGAPAVGCFVADRALVGALVPPMVFDRTEGAGILRGAWQPLQGDLILEQLFGRVLQV